MATMEALSAAQATLQAQQIQLAADNANLRQQLERALTTAEEQGRALAETRKGYDRLTAENARLLTSHTQMHDEPRETAQQWSESSRRSPRVNVSKA